MSFDRSNLSGTGTQSWQHRPSGRQSNSARPPSWVSMLAITLLVPKPLVDGVSTGGPNSSFHSSSRQSGLSFQFTAMQPDNDDRAPYLAALVASSCSASARV